MTITAQFLASGPRVDVDMGEKCTVTKATGFVQIYTDTSQSAGYNCKTYNQVVNYSTGVQNACSPPVVPPAFQCGTANGSVTVQGL